MVVGVKTAGLLPAVGGEQQKNQRTKKGILGAGAAEVSSCWQRNPRSETEAVERATGREQGKATSI